MTGGIQTVLTRTWSRLIVMLLLVPGAFSGCDDSDATGSVTCRDIVCDDGLVCDEVHGRCVKPDQLEVCVGQADGAACEVDGQSGFVCNSGVCVESVCGDGIVDRNNGEECDDGTGNADDAPDACRTDCSVAHCGDGVVDSGEECDGTSLEVTACTDLGEGYTGGSLACLDTCSLDYSACEGGQCGNGRIEAGEECDDGNDVDWDGCTSCEVSEFVVNTFTLQSQQYPQVAMAPDGRFVVVWHSDGQYGAGARSVYGRLYGADGTPDGTEFRVNTYLAGNQDFPDVAMAPDGHFVVVWDSQQDPDGSYGVYARFFNADGTPDGTEFRVNSHTEGIQAWGRIAMAPDGRFVVVWISENQDGDMLGIYGQRFEADGTPDGTEFQVNTSTANTQIFPSVAMAPDGHFVVVWEDRGDLDGDRFGVFGQRFGSDGTPDGTEFQVNTHIQGDQRAPEVAMAPDGRFVVVWASWGQDNSDGSSGIFGQRYDAAGNRIGGEFQVNTYTIDHQIWPSIATASDGRFVVVWQGQGMDTNGHVSIYMQRYDASGVRAAPETRVNVYMEYGQEYPEVAMAPDGRFVVTWDGWWTDGDMLGILAQRFTSDGTPIGLGAW